ncbi:MAG TPA: hypothetical protein EYP23_03210 [Thermoplasmata archaeon]|nr:hypothetical protein [Thermoplasmata archaeon]
MPLSSQEDPWGYVNLRRDPRVVEIVKKAFEENKVVTAICAASAVLGDAGGTSG